MAELKKRMRGRMQAIKWSMHRREGVGCPGTFSPQSTPKNGPNRLRGRFRTGGGDSSPRGNTQPTASGYETFCREVELYERVRHDDPATLRVFGKESGTAERTGLTPEGMGHQEESVKKKHPGAADKVNLRTGMKNIGTIIGYSRAGSDGDLGNGTLPLELRIENKIPEDVRCKRHSENQGEAAHLELRAQRLSNRGREKLVSKER